MLMIITAWVGMYLSPYENVSLQILILSTIGISLSAGSAAILNHFIDRKIDKIMQRTMHRPIANGNISSRNALIFAMVLGIFGIGTLYLFTNNTATTLTALALFGYAGFYTVYLKRATPQNIVIGGLSGAMPPLLGWSCISGDINANSLLLVLIIFIWTPPHFWALAVARIEDYRKASIPMLPVTHGIAYTKLLILLYSILLLPISLLPYATHMSGLFYFLSSFILGIIYLLYNIKLYRTNVPDKQHIIAIKSFNFSIVYLFAVFTSLLLDKLIQGIY